jgi:plasmid stability protein
VAAMTLRNLDPEVTEVLRRRAAVEGRSLNSLLCEILAREADDELRRARMRAQRPKAERLRRRIEVEFGEGTASEKLVRRDRDR